MLDGVEQGAQAGRLAAFGAAGPALGIPGVDVQMRPGPGLGDEPLEEQRGGDRAGEARLAGIVEIGDRAVDQLAIGAVQRQPPERLERRPPGREQIVGEAIVRREQRRQVRPERDPRGAGQGRAVDQQRRPLAVGLGEQIGEHQAALGVGVADLDREPLAGAQRRRPGGSCCRSRCSRPPRSAGAGGRAGRAPSTAWARPSVTAAPPMSFFISCMLLAVLRSRPPVSKHTPLPTRVSLGASGSPQTRSITRGGRALAWPTAWIAG